jgi:superfamily II DNA helicase RecQ
MIDEKAWSLEEILKLVQKYWGFSELRPLQKEAIRAGLDRRDSLVVMPTGGGKSLCYQVPAALTQRTDIVVSPLIALMKRHAFRRHSGNTKRSRGRQVSVALRRSGAVAYAAIS